MNNRLTVRNGPRHHLLSTFRSSPSEDAPSSSQKTRRDTSPDIHAAPLSSDDDNDNDHGASDTEQQLPRYLQDDSSPPSQSKIKEIENRPQKPKPAASTRRSGRFSSGNTSIASSSSPRRRGGSATTTTRPNGVSRISPKRPSLMDDDDGKGKEEDDFELFASSQSQKRGAKRVKAYGGVGRLGGGSNPATTRRGEGSDETKDSSTGVFKVPMLESRLGNTLRNNEEAGPTFRVPKLLSDVSKKPGAAKKIEEDGPVFKVPLHGNSNHNATQTRRSVRLGTTVNEEATFQPPRDDILARITSQSESLIPIPTSSATTDFSTPPLLLELSLSSSHSSPLSTPPDSPSSIQEDDLLRDLPQSSFLSSTTTNTSNSSTNTFICPLCLETIDLSLLPASSHPNPKNNNNKRMNMREQTLFCRSHKTHSAKREYQEKGYPEINWVELRGRVERFCKGVLKDVLQGKKRSWYRDAMERELKSSKRRNQSAAQLMGGGGGGVGGAGGDGADIGGVASWRGTGGYYGPRGAHLFEEIILKELGCLLRNQAANDEIIASRGVSNFVQAVLVPELVVLLIQEDMKLVEDMKMEVGVSGEEGKENGTENGGRDGNGNGDGNEEGESKARRILVESARLGELVHWDD
ncbi:MAG: hypothetical protein M1823_001140 [Watsoniomyces obsoletus]|nr:MAG: hypothetical protein M1823_001140 [Watsoniomyces obsoletus]